MITPGALDAIFGVVTPEDLATDDLTARKTMVRVAVQAVRAGMSVVVDRPGEKIPLCPYTAREAKQADEAAVIAAHEAGKPRAEHQRHACGLHHAFAPHTEADTLKTLLKLAGRKSTDGVFNLGLEPYASRLVIIDCDTPDQLAAFQALHPNAELTVSSPGQIGDGDPADPTTWAHYGGGHIYYRVPDGVVLPADVGVLKAEQGWAAIWANHQVLIPPSSRPEGYYRWLGGITDLPDELRVRIERAAIDRRERVEASRARREAAGPSQADDWAVSTGWEDVLVADGWVPTGMTDNCSCPIWTAPGSHGSPKSATAHEPGCSVYDCERGHGPLHVWTDNPSPAVAAMIAKTGKDTLTIPEVAAAVWHKGNLSKLLREIEGSGLPAIPDHPEAAAAPEMPKAATAMPAHPEAGTGEAARDEQAKPLDEQAKDPEAKPTGLQALPSRPRAEAGTPTPDQPAAELPTGPTEDAGDSEVGLHLPMSFWQSRPELDHIRRAAHARGCGADAALIACLTWLSSLVHHRTGVDIGRSPAPLNLIGLLVGPSGVGKSVSMSVARELIEIPSDLHDGLHADAPLGSGEGLIELYWGTEEEKVTDEEGNATKGRPKKIRKQVRHNAYTFSDEAEGWFAAANRPNSTAWSILRSMWVGTPVGQSNANQDNTRHLKGKDYAFGALLGVQPEKAEPLFDDAVGGTPQRFLFADVFDPTMSIDDAPEHPGPLMRAEWGMRKGRNPAQINFTVPESIAKPLNRVHRMVVAGQATLPDPLDSHATLAVMKVAGLLAVLRGGDRMTVEDWHLAEQVWEMSKAVRSATQTAVAQARIEERQAREQREIALATWKEDAVVTAKADRGSKLVTRVAAKVGRKVHTAAGEVPRRALKDAISGRDVSEHGGGRMALLDLAITEAVATGYVVALDDHGRSYGPGHIRPEM